MKKPKNIERIKYLAYHHKKARVRKKNLKRLQKYGALTPTFGVTAAEMIKALKKLGGAVTKAFNLFGGNWHQGSHAGLFSLGTGYSKSYEYPIGAGFRLLPPLIVDRGDVKFLPPDNADHCVMCGEIIPEGRQVCPICEERSTENGKL